MKERTRKLPLYILLGMSKFWVLGLFILGPFLVIIEDLILKGPETLSIVNIILIIFTILMIPVIFLLMVIRSFYLLEVQDGMINLYQYRIHRVISWKSIEYVKVRKERFPIFSSLENPGVEIKLKKVKKSIKAYSISNDLDDLIDILDRTFKKGFEHSNLLGYQCHYVNKEYDEDHIFVEEMVGFFKNFFEKGDKLKKYQMPKPLFHILSIGAIFSSAILIYFSYGTMPRDAIFIYIGAMGLALLIFTIFIALVQYFIHYVVARKETLKGRYIVFFNTRHDFSYMIFLFFAGSYLLGLFSLLVAEILKMVI